MQTWQYMLLLWALFTLLQNSYEDESSNAKRYAALAGGSIVATIFSFIYDFAQLFIKE